MLAPIIYIVTTSIVWIALGLVTGKRILGPFFLFLTIGVYVIIFPAIFYLADTSGLRSTNYLNSIDDLLVLQAAIICIFSMGMLGGHFLAGKNSVLGKLFPHCDAHHSDVLLMMGVMTLTLGSVFLSGYALNRAGSILLAVAEVRFGGILEGFGFLTQFVRIGGFISVALWMDLLLRKKKGERISGFAIYAAAMMFAVNMFAAFIMGGKSYVVYPLVVLAFSYALYFTKRPIRTLILPALLIGIVIVGLEYVRVVHVKGNSLHENIFVSSIGSSLLDTNMIYLEKMPKQTALGEDFYNGLIGVIPRILWPGKPAQIDAGGRFRKTVTGDEAGGAWPVFGFNLWYGNFGWPGVLICGLLSGWLLAAFRERYFDYRSNPYSLALMVFFTILFIVPAGLDNMTPVKYILNTVPVIIFFLLADLRLYPASIIRQKTT